MTQVYHISIHAPRTGSDLSVFALRYCTANFNPRSPHGERPTGLTGRKGTYAFQSTLPARGATVITLPVIAFCRISIHAPRTGSDAIARVVTRDIIISIHAPRTGSDGFGVGGHGVFLLNFNPRSPHGERQGVSSIRQERGKFQSTLPARGATWMLLWMKPVCPIFQSTLPARGATTGKSASV